MLALLDALALLRAQACPVVVISNTPNAAGIAKARARGVPTRVIDHRLYPTKRATFERKLIAALQSVRPDVICLCGFMRILSPHFVRTFRGKIINIHPSLLPKYRGMNTHKRAIQAGDTWHGCTVHQVTKELDQGRILGQSKLLIYPQDTPKALAQRLLKREHRLYVQVIKRIIAGDLVLFSAPILWI